MPYILAILVALFGSYYFGKHVCNGEHATEVATLQKQTIDAANTESKAATARAVAAAKAEAVARVRAAGIRRKGEIDATAKAKPECDRDVDSMRLLLESIATANGRTSASNSVPDTVHADP